MQRQAPPPPQPQRLDEEDSADELENISTKTLALTRYKRNHELMNEVFAYAAFGQFRRPWRLRLVNVLAMQVINNRRNPQRHTPFLKRPIWKVAWYACAPDLTISGADSLHPAGGLDERNRGASSKVGGEEGDGAGKGRIYGHVHRYTLCCCCCCSFEYVCGLRSI
jgi:hypothetical protein